MALIHAIGSKTNVHKKFFLKKYKKAKDPEIEILVRSKTY